MGGALYSGFGYRGPFIFGIIVTFVDCIGRLLIIERKDAISYGQDTWEMSEVCLAFIATIRRKVEIF